MIKNELPSNLKQISVASKYEIIKIFEGKRFKVAISFSIAIPIIIFIIYPAFIHFLFNLEFYGESLSRYYLINIPVIAYMLIAFPIILGADSLSSEYQKKTGLLLFVQPVRKSMLFLAKYLTYLLLNSVLILTCFFSIFLSGFVFFHPLEIILTTPQLLFALSIATLTSVAYLSITCFFSSLLNRGIYCVALMVFLCFIISPFVAITILPGNKMFIPFFNLPYISMQLMTTPFIEPSMISHSPELTFTDVLAPFTIPLAILCFIFYCIAPIIFTVGWEEHKKMN